MEHALSASHSLNVPPRATKGTTVPCLTQLISSSSLLSAMHQSIGQSFRYENVFQFVGRFNVILAIPLSTVKSKSLIYTILLSLLNYLTELSVRNDQIPFSPYTIICSANSIPHSVSVPNSSRHDHKRRVF